MVISVDKQKTKKSIVIYCTILLAHAYVKPVTSKLWMKHKTILLFYI